MPIIEEADEIEISDESSEEDELVEEEDEEEVVVDKKVMLPRTTGLPAFPTFLIMPDDVAPQKDTRKRQK